ncbi:MAG: carboxypeptidase-like regulatory domain-containing protein, partial [Blastocatellia bacterium]
MKISREILYLLAAVFLSASAVFAQNANSGEIKGAVVDSAGAAIDGVTVTIINVQTGVKTTFSTNSDGIYDAPSVPTGEYKITFSRDGFRDLVRQGIILQIGTITVDAQLQPGAAAEQVIITAQAPLLEKDTSEQHVTLDTKAVTDAPIVGGVWYNELTAV